MVHHKELFVIIMSWPVVNVLLALKAYSQISYRGRSQKSQNLNFLHLFLALL